MGVLSGCHGVPWCAMWVLCGCYVMLTAMSEYFSKELAVLGLIAVHNATP